MRAAVRWAVLAATGVGSLAAQADTGTARATTRQQLEALLASYALARAMHFERSPKDSFSITGFYRSGLRYTSGLEVAFYVRPSQTISVRVFPHVNGGYINLNRVQPHSGFMESLLRNADQNFFHWAADPSLDVFAGFTFTLESGFPEEAIRVVISSIPLIDGTVGQLMSGTQ